MKPHDMLDRVLTGEPVEATDDVLALAELARQIEDTFSGIEPTPYDGGKGLNLALEALRESAPGPARPSRFRRAATRVLVAAAMLVSLPTVAWAASEDALPGELLYPVKRAFEQVRLMIASSPLEQASILLDQAAERLGEAARARALGLDDSAAAAVDAYTEAMAGFGQRIEEARRLGLDVSQEMAIASDLLEHHDALLEALAGATGIPAGSTAGEGTTGQEADSSGSGGSETGAGGGSDAGSDEAVSVAAPPGTEEIVATGGTSDGGISDDGTSGDGTLEDGAEDGTTDASTSDGTTSEAAPPEGTSSGGTSSDETTAGDSTSEGSTSEEGTSEGTGSDGSTSEGETSEATTSEEAASGG